MVRNYFRWILWGAITLAIVVLILYFYNFGSFSFSTNKGDWGTFGDYLGGIIGGILGTALAVISVYLLNETYKAQNAQLRIQENDSNIRYTHRMLK